MHGLINRVCLPFVTSCNILVVFWLHSFLLEPLHVTVCTTICYALDMGAGLSREPFPTISRTAHISQHVSI